MDPRKPRVLVIDDDELVLATLVDALRTAGFETATAKNGRIGVDLLEATSIDAVVTDILMPEQEGLETIREIRRRYPRLGILAISGGGATGIDTQLLKFARELGADRTLPKPFSASELVAAVRALLSGRAGDR
jgi:DNA-binding response OmpR family regulator